MASVPAAHRSFVASCLFNSLFPSLTRRLCILISSSVKGIESKFAQSQNQSAKLATTKHIIYASYHGEETHMHGAKESHNMIVKLSNAHSQVAKSLTKQNCFKMHHLTNKSIATLHTLLTSQPLWNEVSIAVQPE